MIEVIHGNALDYGPDDFELFDVQVIDPPYSAHVHESAASVGTGGMAPGAENNRRDRDLGFDALSPELREQICVCAASVKRWSAVFSDVEGAHDWRESMAALSLEYIRPLPWIRWSQPQLSGDRPPTVLELVNLFHPQHVGPRGGVKPFAKHWNGPGNVMPLHRRAMRGEDKHPTEKGLDLILDLVSWFSDPGESVIDLCCGFGTTALACKLLERDCLAVELKADWARRAASRVSAQVLSARDQARAKEWCETTFEEATALLALPRAKDESDRNTRERAERRLADVDRVMGFI
jgi:hypothetical protein